MCTDDASHKGAEKTNKSNQRCSRLLCENDVQWTRVEKMEYYAEENSATNTPAHRKKVRNNLLVFKKRSTEPGLFN